MPAKRARGSKKDSDADSAAKQTFGGRTFACVSCKNGHRVKTCNHGYTKPIAPTANPGRPSSGNPKKKCNCPKECACSDKNNCKCPPNCICVQTMYLIAHVAQKELPSIKAEAEKYRLNEKGQPEVLREVYADSNGKLLTDAEARRRQEEQSRREQGKLQDVKSESSASSPFIYQSPDLVQAKSSCCSSKSPSASVTLARSCHHASKAASTPSLSRHPSPAPTGNCNCGTSCECIHCPEHANNDATRQYNRQQLNHMTTHQYLPPSSHIPGPLFTPKIPQESCLGGPSRFRLSTEPPLRHELHGLFPQSNPGDHIISWEIKRAAQADFEQYFEQINAANVVSNSNGGDASLASIDVDPALMDMDFPTDLEKDLSSWTNATFGDANVDQIPGYSPTAFQQPRNLVEPAMTPLPMFRPQSHGIPMPRSEFDGNTNYNDIDMTDFLNPSLAGFETGPVGFSMATEIAPEILVAQSTSSREENRDPRRTPWTREFDGIDGPFMGHYASPDVQSPSPSPLVFQQEAIYVGQPDR